jgi:hypothetical protein
MDAELADDLWTMGAGHLIGVKALFEEATRQAQGGDDVEQKVFNGPHSASIHLLIGYSLELLLKAAYVLNGATRRDLGARGVGHDLLLTLDRAEAAGFRSRTPDLRYVVERLSEMHLKHQFRYGGLERFQMPALEVTLPMLEGLAREIGADLRAITVSSGYPFKESGLSIRRPRRRSRNR